MHKIPREVFVLSLFLGLKHFLFQNTGMDVQIRTGIVICLPSFDANNFLSLKLVDDKYVKTWIEPNLHKIGNDLNYAENYRKTIIFGLRMKLDGLLKFITLSDMFSSRIENSK